MLTAATLFFAAITTILSATTVSYIGAKFDNAPTAYPPLPQGGAPAMINSATIASPPQDHSSSTSDAPPPPPSTEFRQQQVDNIVDALIGAGDFASWANMLSTADPSTLPMTLTLFIPSDDALSHLSDAPPLNLDPFIFPYHVVPQRLTFSDLQLFHTHTRLPTLLPNNSILITNNSPSNFTVDDSALSHPDLYITGAVCVHGVASILDYTAYGHRLYSPLGTSTTGSPPGTFTTGSPPSPPHQESHVPPDLNLPSGDLIGGRIISEATRSLPWVSRLRPRGLTGFLLVGFFVNRTVALLQF